MAVRYRKSVKLGGGTKLNIGKSSVGISTGTKGFRMSINSKGRARNTVSIPGTGLSYTKESRVSGVGKRVAEQKAPFFERKGIIILFLIFLAPVGVFLMWKKTNWSKGIKTVLSVLFLLIWSIFVFVRPEEKPVEDTPKPVIEQEVEERALPVIEEQEEQTTVVQEPVAKEPVKIEPVEQKPTEEETIKQVPAQEPVQEPIQEPVQEPVVIAPVEEPEQEPVGMTVYVTPSGKRYHFSQECAGDNGRPISIDDAINKGYTPCQKCAM